MHCQPDDLHQVRCFQGQLHTGLARLYHDALRAFSAAYCLSKGIVFCFKQGEPWVLHFILRARLQVLEYSYGAADASDCQTFALVSVDTLLPRHSLLIDGDSLYL